MDAADEPTWTYLRRVLEQGPGKHVGSRDSETLIERRQAAPAAAIGNSRAMISRARFMYASDPFEPGS
jgi:hypothetical protein